MRSDARKRSDNLSLRRGAGSMPSPGGDANEDDVDWIRRLVGAWDCCGTCAGGVLAERDRRIVANALAAAGVVSDAAAEEEARDASWFREAYERAKERNGLIPPHARMIVTNPALSGVAASKADTRWVDPASSRPLADVEAAIRASKADTPHGFGLLHGATDVPDPIIAGGIDPTVAASKADAGWDYVPWNGVHEFRPWTVIHDHHGKPWLAPGCSCGTIRSAGSPDESEASMRAWHVDHLARVAASRADTDEGGA